MFERSRILTTSLAVLAAASIAGAELASAQVSSHALRDGGDSAPASAGPGRSRLPLIDSSAFPLGGREAQRAPVQGAPFVSPSSIETDSREPQAFGTQRWPYTMARVANSTPTLGNVNRIERSPVTAMPYRATGKLIMRFGGDWFVCTGSLIRPGIVVSAAHCVHNFGQGAAGFADEVLFMPANVSDPWNVRQPYGQYRVRRMYVPTTYRNGRDTCDVNAPGVVCNNDIAVLVLRDKKGVRAGDVVGWYGYGTNGYSYVQAPEFGNATVADITQLGYPLAWDNGYQMQRGNSFGKLVTSNVTTNRRPLINTQLGSAMTGGSSGGPWLVNFGTRPTITGSATAGSQASRMIVVGTTSWGYTTTGPKVQGASFFGQNHEFPNADYGGWGPGNIGALMNSACTAFPAAC